MNNVEVQICLFWLLYLERIVNTSALPAVNVVVVVNAGSA